MTDAERAIIELGARIPTLDAQAMQAAQQRLDQLTKPPGSLGALEGLIVQLAGITGVVRPLVEAPAILVAAGDHGVVAEGISPYPQAVTGQMVMTMLHGGAAINALASQAGARLIMVDAGVATPLPSHPGLRRVGRGRATANFLLQPAMTRAEAARLILAGARLVDEEVVRGLDLLILGEMGIGNTTTSACLTSACTGADPAGTTGRGTGVDEQGLARKQAVVRQALARARCDRRDPVGVLAEVGGFEQALLVGAALAAAARRVPLLLDGYVVASAMLVATALAPRLAGFLIAGHRSAEPGHAVALSALGLRPLLALEMRLGEGSGAALALPIIHGALRTMREMATFAEAGVTNREDDGTEKGMP